MHYIDIILLILFFVTMVYYFWKGFISSVLAFVGLFVTLVMIARYGPMVKYGIMIRFGIGEFFSNILACLLIFVLISVLIAILKLLLNYMAKLLKLTFINRVLGAAFGFVNVMIVIVLFFMFLDSIPFLSSVRDHMNHSVIITETHKIYRLVKYNIRDKLPPDFFI